MSDAKTQDSSKNPSLWKREAGRDFAVRPNPPNPPFSKGGNIGIVVATRFEASPIFRQLKFKREPSGLYKAQPNGKTVWLAISGVGMEPARRASNQLCDAGAKELVSVGYCGALSRDLKVGDLVTDRIATSPRPVWKTEARLALAERAGAQAVDMETQAVIEAGTRRGVPIRILRVVSDQLGDDVSPLLGEEPNFSIVRILLRLWKPTRWPYLYKMWRQSQIASRRLGQVVGSYLSDEN